MQQSRATGLLLDVISLTIMPVKSACAPRGCRLVLARGVAAAMGRPATRPALEQGTRQRNQRRRQAGSRPRPVRQNRHLVNSRSSAAMVEDPDRRRETRPAEPASRQARGPAVLKAPTGPSDSNSSRLHHETHRIDDHPIDHGSRRAVTPRPSRKWLQGRVCKAPMHRGGASERRTNAP